MRPPILIGIAVAILIGAAAFLTPLFRSAGRKAADRAAESAALAQRELARVDPYLQRVADVVDANSFAQADLDLAVKEAAPALQKIADESRKLVQQATALAQRDGLPAPDEKPLSPTAAGVKQSLADVERMLKANDALLKEALENAKDAIALYIESLLAEGEPIPEDYGELVVRAV